MSAETGGAGDDIALQLADGNVLEVQAKRKLKADPELWDALVALCRRAQEDATFNGVLAVGPMTSTAIRDQLARDIIRLGQGREDDLSLHAVTLKEKLSAASIPLSSCARVRIQTVHVLEQDGASAHSAVAYLSHITIEPGQAWGRLKVEGLRLIKLRGRQDAVGVAGIIPALRAGTSGGVGPAVVAAQLLDWTLNTTGAFTIPAVDNAFSLDSDWIELKAYGQDTPEVSLGSLEEALTKYHEGSSGRRARQNRDLFDAESLGYFVRQCVVVAGPGMGKTQLLRRIGRLLARKNEPSLFIRLRPLAERMRGGETFLEAALQIGLDASPLRPQDVRTLGMQNLTLLLDGLDESGIEQEHIAKAAADLAASYPRCRIVFTTRPIGYETALLNTWKHYELVPIDASDAKRGVERLVDAAKGDGNAKIKDATVAATSHLDYQSQQDHKFSARSPLLVALLASLALNEVIAAATREGLYGQLFSLIERMTAPERKATSAKPAVLNAFLHQLGWELTAQPYASAKDVLRACAQRLAVELNERPLKAELVCDEALAFWEKVGIVERVRFKASETLTFVHKTFGEYAAALYVLSRTIGERAQLLAEIEPAQQWNEVAVFSSAMGLGPDLVQLALHEARTNSIETTRLLRWVRHSKDQLNADLAEMVLQQAWEVIAGPHSGQALRVGTDLVAALDKLPGAAVHSQTYRGNYQWWTALVGWTCFVHTKPDLLDFSALLAFMDSYAEVADTGTASGGFVLHSPVRELWEKLLLPSAQAAVGRGMGTEEKKFIARLNESLGARSMGFVGELTFILKKAGVTVTPTDQENLFSRYFSPEFLKHSRQEILNLLDAIGENEPEHGTPAHSPLLHLSAFWYGTGLMKMELSAAVLASKDAGKGEARQIVKLAARASSFDYGQLIAEAQEKIRALKGSDGLARSFDGFLSVDAPVQWAVVGKSDSGVRHVIAQALLHPSRWIVYLAVNLAEQLLNSDDIAELVPRVLAESNGVGMEAAAYLAVHVLGKERARELIVARLKQPLNTGCQHLYEYLAEIWTPELDSQASELLKLAMPFGPRTAKAALHLARACCAPQRKFLTPILKDAYDYWLKNEEPYPAESGTIPESPRGDILELLIEEAVVSEDYLFDAAKDPRSEVSEQAKKALMEAFSKSEISRNELVRRLQAGESLNNLLIACLRVRLPFCDSEVQLIAGLLESENPQTRSAAAGILEGQYLSPSEIRTWAEKLSNDSYQSIKDKGYERLAALNKTGL